MHPDSRFVNHLVDRLASINRRPDRPCPVYSRTDILYSSIYSINYKASSKSIKPSSRGYKA